MTHLKTVIEEDNWQPADIPYSYLAFFNLFFDPAYDMQSDTREETDYTEELLRSSRPSYRGVLSPQLTDLDQTNESVMLDLDTESPEKTGRDEESKNSASPKKPSNETSIVKIMKNELYIEQKRYKLTHSALLLIKIIYDYLHLGQKYKGISMECVLKVIEIMKVHPPSFHCRSSPSVLQLVHHPIDPLRRRSPL